MVHLITFQGGDKYFALKTQDIQEIIHIPELSNPGGMPCFLKGFFNIEGKIYGAVDLAELLGLPPSLPGLYTPLLVMKKPAQTAFIIDSLGELLKVEETEFKKISGNSTFNNCIEMLIHFNDKQFFIPDINKLLLEIEKAKIQEFHKIEKMRINRLMSNGKE